MVISKLYRIIENIESECMDEPELEMLSILKSDKLKDDKPSPEFDLISQYSTHWDYKRKISDLKEVSNYSSHHQSKSISFFKSSTINPNQYKNKRISIDHLNEKKINNNKKFSVSEAKMVFENFNENINYDLQTFSEEHRFQINEMLLDIENSEFNVFKFNEIAEKKSLYLISESIFKKLNLFDLLIPEDQFRCFLSEIIAGYDRNVPFHNDLHVSDVLQTSFTILSKGNFIEKLNLNVMDTFAITLSAIIHDFKHPGLDNLYQTKMMTKLAVRYNDSSILVNYHIAESFKLIMKDKNNIFINLIPEQYRLIRRSVINCVLFTDMTNHVKNLSHLNSLLLINNISNGENLENLISGDNISKIHEHKQIILGLLLHASDISNPCKPKHLHKKWVDLLMKEYLNQEEKEKENKIPVSLFCDRSKLDINKSQFNFIKIICLPTFETILKLNPEIEHYLKTARENLADYEKLIN